MNVIACRDRPVIPALAPPAHRLYAHSGLEDGQAHSGESSDENARGGCGKAGTVRYSFKRWTLARQGRGQVLMKIGVSGVCHSDLSVVTGAIQLPLPAALGHEGAGVVEQVGNGVRSVQPGDRAMLAFVTACGQCRYCVIGKPNLCSVHWRAKRGSLCDGTNPFQRGGETVYQMSSLGTMAERTVVMENAVIPIPPDVSFERAALVGCGVMTGVGAVLFTAKAEPGSRVAVIGAGGVGVNVIQGAVLAGAETIIAVDVSDKKLEMAKPFGATHLVNAKRDDPVEVVRELTGGEGVDYAFEAIGNPKTIEQAFAMLSFGGAAVVIGIAAQGGEGKHTRRMAALRRTAAHRVDVRLGAYAG